MKTIVVATGHGFVWEFSADRETPAIVHVEWLSELENRRKCRGFSGLGDQRF